MEKCWEILECTETKCPAYESANLQCWLIPQTLCNDSIQGNFLDKIELCIGCSVFAENIDRESIKDTLKIVDRQFREFRTLVQEHDREMERIGLELSISLSEVFEALRRIAKGDPSVVIPENSSIELISMLKRVVNRTAEDLNENVNLCHEFAIGLAEHFDVLHRVTKGDLNARVSGGSDMELLESLKNVTNDMIANISEEITKRRRAEEEHKQLETKYRVIFENAGAPTIIFENDMNICMANKAFERFSGYSKENIEGEKNLFHFILKDDLEKMKAAFEEGMSGQTGNKSHEFRFLGSKGNVKHVMAIVSHIPGSKMSVASLLEIAEFKQREMEAIAAITTALRSAQTRADMLPIIIDQLMEFMRADGVSLAMRDPASGETVIETSKGDWSNWTGVRLLAGEGISGTVIKTGKPYVNNSALSNTRFARPDLIGDLKAVACVPLMTLRQTIGAIWIGRRSDIESYEIQLLTTIGEIAANAIQRATLYEQTEQRLQRLYALHAIDMAISASLDLRVTLNILLEHVTSQLNTDAATVLLMNASTGILEYAASRGFRSRTIKQTRLRIGEGHAGKAALERRIINVPNVMKTEDPCVRSQILAGEVFLAHHAVPLIIKGQVKGVLEVFHRTELDPDPEWLEFFEALAAQAAIAIDNASLFDELQRSNIELTLAYDTTLEGWSHALDMRDKETEGHTLRVTEMTTKLARSMGMSDAEVVHIRRGALLHDIGKMAIPDTVLLKPGPLNKDEYEIMCKHPTYAYEMLMPIFFLRHALNIPYCHHEKWDGTGYPRRLKEEQIPLEACIFAVVDVWDALRSDRPYRAAWSEQQTLEYILNESGKHFDPKVVKAFVKILKNQDLL
ncbi:MAG: GAF domain-containing protein [Thermodesulfovibrionales bacterium]|nr:GAF domain-containing protein [Thermodesulfovibrionales bacterium]